MFPVTALPAMAVAAAGASVLLAIGSAWALTRAGPRRLIPAGFALSAGLLLAEWWLLGRAGRVAAVLIYLHYAAFGAVLVSGFWSIVSERFDPRTTRRQVSRIGGAGTLGGVVGGLLAAGTGATLTVPIMLPLLAACHLGAAAFALATGRGTAVPTKAVDDEPFSMHAAARLPYLRILVAVVLLTTLAEFMIDYVFKARLTAVVGRGEDLLRFFAWFYTATGLLAFGAQMLLSRRALRVLGLARSVGTLPVTAAVGGGGALLLGGLGPVVVARGAEAVVRSSLYRSGYELLFAPLLPSEKRASKTVLDVGMTRVGDVVGAVVVRLTLVTPAAGQVLLVLAVVASGVAAALALRLGRGYAAALERALATRAGQLDAPTIENAALESALIHTVGGSGFLTVGAPRDEDGPEPDRDAGLRAAPAPHGTDRRAALRSSDPAQVEAALAAGPLSRELVAEAVQLLAWDAVAPLAVRALRQAAPDSADQLVAALLNPDEEFSVRRRLPLVLTAAPGQSVVDGLLAGLHDARFEVRYRCGLALHRLLKRNPDLRVEQHAVLDAVLREVSVDRRVWESYRLLDQSEDEEWSPLFDAVLQDRASRGLQHVFNILALVLPRRPLQLAYRGLFATDPHVRGTALEYLETTLPEAPRKALWPFLEDTRRSPPPRRSREEVVRDLLASEATIALDLKRLRRPSDGG